MKTYYFSETFPADAAGDAILLPQSSFLSMDVTSATEITLNFKKIDGTHDVSTVKLAVGAGNAAVAMKNVAAAMAGNTKSNIIDIVEAANKFPSGGVLANTDTLISAITIGE